MLSPPVEPESPDPQTGFPEKPAMSAQWAATSRVNPRFETLWLEDGLPDKTVRAVAQDAQGFIWLGTSHGLARYDGTRMEVLAADPERPNSLAHNRVFALLLSHRGDLWVATGGGLSRYRPEHRDFESQHHDPKDDGTLSSDLVLSLEDAGDGTLWVGTAKGLDRFDPETGRAQRLGELHPPLQAGNIRALHRDVEGRLWIGTRDGVFTLDGSTQTLRRAPLAPEPGQGSEITSAGSQGPRVQAIASGLEGEVWVGTRGQGLLRWDKGSDSLQRVTEPVTDDVIFSLASDPTGALWVGTMEQGLFRRSPEGLWGHSQADPGDATSLKDNAILTLFVDRSQTLWAGSFQAGVHRVGLRTLELGRHDNGRNSLSCMPSAVTNDLLLLGPDLLLVATDTGLAAIHGSTGQCEVYTHDPRSSVSLSSSTVLSLEQDHDSGSAEPKVWVGTLDGLDRLNLADGKVERIPAIRSLPVYVLASSASGDRSADLWVGTTKGLYRFAESRLEPVEWSQVEASSEGADGPLKVNSISFDQRGGAWLGTGLGLLTVDPGTGLLARPAAVEGSPELASRVGAVHVDAAGTVWVGVDEVGLFAIKTSGERWSPMGIGEELPDFKRFGTLFSDTRGFLWAATTRGLHRIHPVDRTVTSFRASDGLQSEDFIGNSMYRSETGAYFLGGRRGFNVFEPESLTSDDVVPEIGLTRLFHFNQALIPGEPHRGFTLPAPIDQLDRVTLTHHDYVFGFEFAALHFADPSRNRLAYRLHGFEEDWNSVEGGQGRATYTNLAPGDYEFQVQGANPHGAWNRRGTSLQVRVLPAPWRTWQAYVLYVVLALAMILSLFWYRTTALRRRARELEQGVRERTAIIETLLEQKDEEMATLSHEFRTPLTLILGPTKNVLRSVKEPGLRRQLSVVRRNAFRLLRMVDQLLHMEGFRVQVALPRRSQPVKRVVESIGESFRDLAAESEIEVVIGPVEEMWVCLVPDTLEKVLLNLLSNAVKYTPEGGRIELSAVMEQHRAAITISDTGIGIAREQQTRIFQRYQRVLEKEGDRVAGAGIGLALVKELVEAHEGTIELDSEPGSGTRFTVRLPLDVSPQVGASQDLDTELLELELQTLMEQKRTAREPGWGSPAPTSSQVPMDEPIEDGRPQVLIIEDNPDMSSYIADTLAPRFQCRAALDGESGLELAWQEIPDLIISDIMMPKVDGFEVVRKLKDDERSSHIPVILLTARGDRKSRHRGWQERADEYLTKPFDEKELLLRVDNLLEIREILRRRFAQELAPGAKRLESAGRGLNPRDREFLEKFQQMIANQFEDPELKLSRMTSLMALSERPLQRKLKALIGQTPIEYLRAYRLNRAGELLHEGLLVAEVADRTGFSSQAYFATCFKAHFGVTPSEYRDRLS